MTKIVFFDLDGTLIDNPSSEQLFFYFLIKKHYIGWKQLWNSYLFTQKWITYFKKEIFIKNKCYLSGLAIEEITTVAEQFAHQHLLSRIRPHIKHRLDEHLQAKDIVILLTGSPKFIATVFADTLGIKELYATEIAQNSTHFSNAPPLQHPYALEKLKIAQKVCTKYQTNIADTIAYANSIHDRALLEACGTPITVTPDKKLRIIAQNKQWEIID